MKITVTYSAILVALILAACDKAPAVATPAAVAAPVPAVVVVPVQGPAGTPGIAGETGPRGEDAKPSADGVVVVPGTPPAR